MAITVLAAKLILAAVFLVAGVAKLADLAGSRRAVAEFGVPGALAKPAGTALPLVELAASVLLLPSNTARTGALIALVLLVAFCLAIVFNLTRGRAPECHCFGQLHSEPAGWLTLARNCVLLLLAAFIAATTGSASHASAIAWVGRLSGTEIAAFVAIATSVTLLALGGVTVMHLLRSYGKLLIRLDRIEAAFGRAGFDSEGADPDLPQLGLEPGSPAPVFSLDSLEGGSVGLSHLLARGPAMLVLSDSACGPCAALMPRIAEWQRDHADALTIAVLSAGPRDEVRREAERTGLRLVLLDSDRSAYEAYQGNGTPSAVLIAVDGTIASYIASGQPRIERLVENALAKAAREQGLPVGALPPDFELPALGGAAVSLTDLRGRETMLLFWNPGCGFCRGMHEELRGWEASPPPGAPRLVVVSAGSQSDIAQEGFRSLVLLDNRFQIGRAFGAGGTPTAVLLDSAGRVASGLVTGRSAVLALGRANGRRQPN